MPIVHIPLTQGKTAIIDEDDAELVSLCQWYAFRCVDAEPELWYARSVVCGETRILLHRLLMGVPNRRVLVDHWNGDGLDCQRRNIRECSKAQNNVHMRSARKGATSKFNGVSFDATRGLWRAVIESEGTYRQIGRFANEEDAARARDEVAVRLHGAFALLNFPDEHPFDPPAVDAEQAALRRRAAFAWIEEVRARYELVRRSPGRPKRITPADQ